MIIYTYDSSMNCPFNSANRWIPNGLPSTVTAGFGTVAPAGTLRGTDARRSVSVGYPSDLLEVLR